MKLPYYAIAREGRQEKSEHQLDGKPLLSLTECLAENLCFACHVEMHYILQGMDGIQKRILPGCGKDDF